MPLEKIGEIGQGSPKSVGVAENSVRNPHDSGSFHLGTGTKQATLKKLAEQIIGPLINELSVMWEIKLL